MTGQLCDALDRYRRRLRRDHPKEEVLKGIKWLLLKHQEELTQEEQYRLEAAFECFPQLEQCYFLKETIGNKLFSAGMKKENIPSYKSFISCGFRKWKEDEEKFMVKLNIRSLVKPEDISQIEVLRNCEK